MKKAETPAQAAAYQERWVRRGDHRIYVRMYPGGGPPLVLLHGFPDSLHLYDRLVPHLSPERQVVTFDFLGWGASDKPADYPYTAVNQTADLDAVVDQLGLDQVVLVAHDASGPPAIDWSLAHPERVDTLVLLNTYYHWTPSLRRPPAIFLYSTPLLRNLARLVTRRFEGLDRKLFAWQVGRFVRDDGVRNEVVPALYEDFGPARPAFWRLNSDLLGTAVRGRRMLASLRSFAKPVQIIFGATDPWLNASVARQFHDLFPNSQLHLVPEARHYVQIDEPAEVARLILSASHPERTSVSPPADPVAQIGHPRRLRWEK